MGLSATERRSGRSQITTIRCHNLQGMADTTTGMIPQEIEAERPLILPGDMVTQAMDMAAAATAEGDKQSLDSLW